MKKRTVGAWIIHHTKKIHDFADTPDFDDIELAGKCGIFLSNLAASDEQSDLNSSTVNAIAKVSSIKKTEIETIKTKLAEAQLIDIAKNGSVSVLGITSSSVLDHTSDIFTSCKPNHYQQASIALAENISNLPKKESILKEYISDNFQLKKSEVNDLFSQSEEIGFVDSENLPDDSKFYFNGNLFRKEAAKKTDAVLSSLIPEDTRKILEVDKLLTAHGCITLESARRILGDALLSKLQAIGMYDHNEVSNPKETKTFITKPSAFSKYGNPFEEDALDLAKAFVSALYYGMHFSEKNRGKITMLKALMEKLVAGGEVGPATAIGQDYQILEYKRVIKIRHEGSYKYYMRLLKKDIGELAMQVLEFGDANEQSLLSNLSTESMTSYIGPEQKRTMTRKHQSKQSKQSVAETLNALRTYR